MDDLLSETQASIFLGLGKTTLGRWRKEGLPVPPSLLASGIRLYSREDLARWKPNAEELKWVPLGRSHGTANKYKEDGCRCEECVEAYRAARRNRRRRKERVAAGQEVKHGTLHGYGMGCRCDRCRSAQKSYDAEWRKNNPEKVREYQRRARERRAAREASAADGSEG